MPYALYLDTVGEEPTVSGLGEVSLGSVQAFGIKSRVVSHNHLNIVSLAYIVQSLADFVGGSYHSLASLYALRLSEPLSQKYRVCRVYRNRSYGMG